MHSVRLTPDSPNIIGREAERRTLSSCIEMAGNGTGALVLVSGESGIGKTALAHNLIRQAAERDFSILVGNCYDLTTTPPFGPWIDAVNDAQVTDTLPWVPDWLAGSGEFPGIDGQSALFEEFRRLLAEMTGRQPLLILLEDLHWSDPASLDLLRYLARSCQGMPLLLVGTFREDDLEPNHPLYRLLPALVRESRAVRVALQGLGDDDVRELIREHYTLQPEEESRLVRYLQSRAEGNPLFLLEILRVLERERILWEEGHIWQVGDLELAPVPPLVRQLIEDRLAGLDRAVRQLLNVAAVIGQGVPIDVWQAAAGASAEELAVAMEQASSARLITETAGTQEMRFSHSQIRETLYQGIVLPRRREIHRRVAEVLSARPHPVPNTVASHLAGADDPAAIEWLIRAGDQALALYSAHDAVAAFTRAHSLADRLSQELPVAAYRGRAAAHEMLGDFDAARRDYETALERSRASGDRAVEWQLLLDLGLLWAARDYERTGRYYSTALDLARTTGDKVMVAYSLNRIANWHVNQEEPAIALPLHREALELFEQSADKDGIADTLDHLGMASYLHCDLVGSTEYCERAIQLLRELDDRPRLATCLATLPFNGGDLTCNTTAPVYRESTYWIQAGEEALEIARDIDWPSGEAYALFSLSLARSTRGDLERALREAETALQIAEDIGHRQWQVAARNTIGIIWEELLDVERARGELEHALTSARRSGSQFWVHNVAAKLATLLIADGAIDEAEAVLETIPHSAEPPVSLGQRQCAFARARLALARGDTDRALALVEHLDQSRPAGPHDHGVPQLQQLHGDVLAHLGHVEAAEVQYQSARRSAALFGYLPLLWRIDLALAELYRDMDRPTEARESLQAAQSTIDELAGMISTQSIRESFLAAASARFSEARQTEEASAAASAGLSPRELEVLKLLAEGKTDREIADALFISPRTVMRHVATILNKLDVPSRTAAASRAIRENII